MRIRTSIFSLVFLFFFAGQSNAQIIDSLPWFKAPLDISTGFYEGWPSKLQSFEGVMSHPYGPTKFRAKSTRGISAELGAGLYSLKGKFKADLNSFKSQKGMRKISGTFTPTHYKAKGGRKWIKIENGKVKKEKINIAYKAPKRR